MRVKPRGTGALRIAFVGEAPGEDEDRWGLCFVGASGKELKVMCDEAGFSLDDCYITNVFMDRPPGNRIGAFCASKDEVNEEAKALGWKTYPFPHLSQGLYVTPYRCLELLRLRADLIANSPNIVVPLGNTALWALKQVTGINKWRGAVTTSTLVPFKILPTIHPAAIFRAYHQRLIVVADLIKALRESKFPEIRYTEREIWISPTLSDIRDFIIRAKSATVMAVDIETHTYKSGEKYIPFISMISFAISRSFALVIPFIKSDGSAYWNSLEEELEAWELVQEILLLPCEKVLQNGLFDVQHCMEAAIYIWNYCRDTMLKHHSLYPGMQKGLGFQGSIYTNEGPWKQHRPHSMVEKPDD